MTLRDVSGFTGTDSHDAEAIWRGEQFRIAAVHYDLDGNRQDLTGYAVAAVAQFLRRMRR